jgi:hypothetical protein
VALPRLLELWDEDQLKIRYPHLNLYNVQQHVERNAKLRAIKPAAERGRSQDRRHRRNYQPSVALEGPPERWPRQGPHEVELSESQRSYLRAVINHSKRRSGDLPVKSDPEAHMGAIKVEVQNADEPPLNTPGLSSGGNPVKLEPGKHRSVRAIDELDKDEAGQESDESSSQPPFTVLDSESDTSVFGLRSMLHEVEDEDELSDSSSQGDSQRARAGRECAYKWRTEHSMQDDLDFAYAFVTFDEAYASAGRAVAMSWSRARLLAEPEMTTDMAKISAVEATATKIRRVDERKKEAVVKKRKMASAAFLRQPGKGTEAEEKDDDKARFIEPLANLMRDCGVRRLENT